MVLLLAHSDALGGHTGAEKAEPQITVWFYWPVVTAEVKSYCNSCPTCQLTDSVSRFRNHLVPVSIF